MKKAKLPHELSQTSFFKYLSPFKYLNTSTLKLELFIGSLPCLETL